MVTISECRSRWLRAPATNSQKAARPGGFFVVLAVVSQLAERGSASCNDPSPIGRSGSGFVLRRPPTFAITRYAVPDIESHFPRQAKVVHGRSQQHVAARPLSHCPERFPLFFNERAHFAVRGPAFGHRRPRGQLRSRGSLGPASLAIFGAHRQVRPERTCIEVVKSCRQDTLLLDSREGQDLLAQGSSATAPCPTCSRKAQCAEPARLAAVRPAPPKGTQEARPGPMPASLLPSAQVRPPSRRHRRATPETRCASRSR